MPLIVFLALMIALLLFILWDRRQPAKAVSRAQMSKGFAPGSSAKWAGCLGLACVGVFLGLNEFMNPSAPPFTGKGSTMKALAYEAFGEHGPALFWLGMSAVFMAAAYVSYRSSSSPSQNRP